MTYKYRCSRCRVRHTFVRLVDDYIRPKKCKACGYTTFYWDKERNGRRPLCTCDNYPYTHRKGSRMCEHNPMHELNDRLRQGESYEDAIIEMSWECEVPVGVQTEQAPF
jgi:hypothetical protein